MRLLIKALIIILCFFLAIYLIFQLTDQEMFRGTRKEVAQESWYTFEDPQGKFAVSLPSIPHQASENFSDPVTQELRKYDMYISEGDNGTIYMISLISFPQTGVPKQMDALLKQVVENIRASDRTSEIKEMEDTTYKGKESVDFQIVNNKFTIDGRLFFHENSLYVLTIIAKSEIDNKKEFDAFTNSFHFNTESSP